MGSKRVSKVLLTKNSPFRPVQWRYDRIMELLHAGGNRQSCPIRGVDDVETIRGYSFIRKWEHICRVVPHEDQLDHLAEIYPENPALYHAYEVFQRPADDYVRNAIEARILARQTDERIAKCVRLGMPESVDWYEKLFFNVRDSLDSVDYISKQVIGPVVGTGTENVTMQLSAKFFGYFCGEAMLEFMLQGIDRSIAPPQTGDGIMEYADAFFNAMLRSRSMITATSFQMDTFKVTKLLEIHSQLIAEHNKTKLVAGPKNQLEETMAVLLTALPFSVGNSQNRKTLLDSSPLGGYIGHAAEPRAGDMLRIASGEEVPHLADLHERKLPPARKKKEERDEDAKQGSRGSDS